MPFYKQFYTISDYDGYKIGLAPSKFSLEETGFVAVDFENAPLP